MVIEVTRLEPDDARDAHLVAQLVGVINDAYAVGEAGLWIDGAARTRPAEIRRAIRDGEILAADEGGKVKGCVRVRHLDAETADLGMLAVPPGSWGGGVGRILLQAAEAVMRTRGVRTMRLELLVPQGGEHPEKVRLRDWYTRHGYDVTRTAPFEEVAGHLAPQLRVPCEFLIFHKPL